MAAGLITGIVGGIVVGSLAGCPLQVSGPAAGLTVIVYEIVQHFGLEMLGLVVLVAGGMQIWRGRVPAGAVVSRRVAGRHQGMLAGIGVLIFASQFHVMVDDKPRGSGSQNLAGDSRGDQQELSAARLPAIKTCRGSALHAAADRSASCTDSS